MTYHEAAEYFKKINEENIKLKNENEILKKTIEGMKNIATQQIEKLTR